MDAEWCINCGLRIIRALVTATATGDRFIWVHAETHVTGNSPVLCPTTVAQPKVGA